MKPQLRIRHVGLIVFMLAAVILASSCSKGKDGFSPPDKLFPETELTYAPIQFDTTSFRIHFYWNGFDEDGEVMRFRFAVDSDTLRPSSEWPSTSSKDTTLLFLVDPVKELKLHVFKIAAEDNDGKIDQTPATRAFSAKTVPPTSRIERGPAAFNPSVGPNFTFEWSGIDPDGGETGGKVPVDTFQYLLLRVGAVADLGNPPTHPPLPAFTTGGPDLNNYSTMIRAAVGDGLLAPWDDWKWVGIRALKNRFRNVTPGEYVFGERAVDIAGATEKDLRFVRNIRHFTVTNRNAGPLLIVRSSILNRPLDGATGPDDFARKQLQIFEGETVSFSWSASAESYGGEIVGYTYALDDTSTFEGLDVRQTGATFQPSRLPPGPHFLYVRTMDDGGLVTNLVLPLLVIRPRFKEPGWPHQVLFVDDSSVRLGNGSAPTDRTETDWWTLLGPDGHGPLQDLGVPYLEWDTLEHGEGSVEGRKQPAPSDLSEITTVIWTTDAENGGSTQSALFKTVAGGDYSELQGYLRAGGTLILTGWNLAQNTSGQENLTYKVGGPPGAVNGICSAYPPGSLEYDRTIFPRMYMGIDNSYPHNQTALRTAGDFDFVTAVPTTAGAALGFTTARVDTGNYSFGVQYPDPSGSGSPTFKWNTNEFPPPFNPNQSLFPGLAGVEAWIMARNYGCQPIQNIGVENPAIPVVQPILLYHGVRQGVIQDGGPSPREGLVCGTFGQSHDLGTNAGRYVPTAAVGRTAFFSFPLYFLKDADAVGILTKAFNWVDNSPTLGGGGP